MYLFSISVFIKKIDKHLTVIDRFCKISEYTIIYLPAVRLSASSYAVITITGILQVYLIEGI